MNKQQKPNSQTGVKSSEGVPVSLAASEAAFELLPSNGGRIEFIVYNDTNKDLLIRFGTDNVTEILWSEKLLPEESISNDNFIGRVSAKNLEGGAPPTGSVKVTELI